MKQSINSLRFDKTLFDFIICPSTKQSLIWDRKKNELISKKARLAYPIINGIPVLIKEKARRL